MNVPRALLQQKHLHELLELDKPETSSIYSPRSLVRELLRLEECFVAHCGSQDSPTESDILDKLTTEACMWYSSCDMFGGSSYSDADKRLAMRVFAQKRMEPDVCFEKVPSVEKEPNDLMDSINSRQWLQFSPELIAQKRLIVPLFIRHLRWQDPHLQTQARMLLADAWEQCEPSCLVVMRNSMLSHWSGTEIAAESSYPLGIEMGRRAEGALIGACNRLSIPNEHENEREEKAVNDSKPQNDANDNNDDDEEEEEDNDSLLLLSLQQNVALSPHFQRLSLLAPLALLRQVLTLALEHDRLRILVVRVVWTLRPLPLLRRRGGGGPTLVMEALMEAWRSLSDAAIPPPGSITRLVRLVKDCLGLNLLSFFDVFAGCLLPLLSQAITRADQNQDENQDEDGSAFAVWLEGSLQMAKLLWKRPFCQATWQSLPMELFWAMLGELWDRSANFPRRRCQLLEGCQQGVAWIERAHLSPEMRRHLATMITAEMDEDHCQRSHLHEEHVHVHVHVHGLKLSFRRLWQLGWSLEPVCLAVLSPPQRMAVLLAFPTCPMAVKHGWNVPVDLPCWLLQAPETAMSFHCLLWQLLPERGRLLTPLNLEALLSAMTAVLAAAAIAQQQGGMREANVLMAGENLTSLMRRFARTLPRSKVPENVEYYWKELLQWTLDCSALLLAHENGRCLVTRPFCLALGEIWRHAWLQAQTLLPAFVDEWSEKWNHLSMQVAETLGSGTLTLLEPVSALFVGEQTRPEN
jgi:hypothetical protein